MTIQQVKHTIQDLGLTVRHVDGEYRVSFPIPTLQARYGCSYKEAQDRNEAMAYYTTEPDDAIDTACAMATHGLV